MEKYDKIMSKYIGGSNFIMCKASELGKVIVNKCIEKGFSINTPKIQKLLTIMQGEHLAKFNKPLFEELILAWSCGVAIKEVNTDFSNYDSEIKENLQAYIILLDSEEEIINMVLNKYGDKDALTINSDYRLVKLVKKYYEENKSNIIPQDEIKEVFLNELY